MLSIFVIVLDSTVKVSSKLLILFERLFLVFLFKTAVTIVNRESTDPIKPSALFFRGRICALTSSCKLFSIPLKRVSPLLAKVYEFPKIKETPFVPIRS